MSSNPTQPKFTGQGEGVNFPPEDDAEGHRFAAMGEGDGQPEGYRALLAEGDDRPEGFRAALSDAEDDTEGHRRLVMADGGEDDAEGHAFRAFVDGRPGGQPEAMEPAPSREGFAARVDGDEDTEGHRLAAFASPDGQPQDGPEGLRVLQADGGQPDGFRARAADAEDDTEGHRMVMADGEDQGQDGFAAR